MLKKLEPHLMSYLRAAIASAAALYISGITDPKLLINAFVAGFIGPVLKALEVPLKKKK